MTRSGSVARHVCTRTEKNPLICGMHYWFSAKGGLLLSLNCNIYTKKNENGDRKQITSPDEHIVFCTKTQVGLLSMFQL